VSTGDEACPVEVIAEQQLPTSLLFVDGTNLDHRCLEAFGRNDIDYVRFFAALAAGTRLQRVHYFTAPYIAQRNQDAYRKQMSDLNALKAMSNVSVHLGRHQEQRNRCRGCGIETRVYVEKKTDVGAACELVRASCLKVADRLILVSGDTDFAPALQIARAQSVHCEVAFVIGPDEFGHKFMELSDLRHAAKRFIKLDDQFMYACWRVPLVKAKET
jgi:uncharacterized LabA/DUF88 family protein